MQIEYKSLHHGDALGRATSEKCIADELPNVVQALMSQLSCRSLLHVGSKSGELLRILRTQGINCVGADFRPSAEPGIEHVDLSRHNGPQELDPILGRLPYTAKPTLLTCFDTLERIAREEISSALWNLRKMCGEWLFTSVNTRPSSKHNAYHATLLPRSTWLLLFDAMGFSLEKSEAIDSLHVPVEYPDDPSLWCMHQWKLLNPYKESLFCESHYLLLRKRDEAELKFEDFDRKVARILGLNANQPMVPESQVFTSFLLGHYQEFLIFEPFFKSLRKDSFRVLLRSGPFDAIESHRKQSLISYLEARGIEYQSIDSIESLSWSAPPHLKNHALVTAIDSTAVHSHLVNSAIVLDARRNGIRTFQLQHGIWPHSEFPKQLAISSDYLLTWSADFERPFLLDGSSGGNAGETDNQAAEHKKLPTRQRVINVGSPRFSTAYGRESASIVELFGDWAARYRHSILVATNLHWPLHAKGNAVLPQLAKTAQEMPETLFVCKLHPTHDFDPTAFVEMPENVIVVDEFVSLYGELNTPRLVNACDAVVCTQSTVALETAIAGKPLSVLDTGNPNQYAGIEPSEIEQFSSTCRQLLEAGGAATDAFLAEYYDAHDPSNALWNVIDAIQRSFEEESPKFSSSDLVATAFSQSFLREAEARHRAESEVERLTAQLHALPQSKTTSPISSPVVIDRASLSSQSEQRDASVSDERVGHQSPRRMLKKLMRKTMRPIEKGVKGLLAYPQRTVVVPADSAATTTELRPMVKPLNELSMQLGDVPAGNESALEPKNSIGTLEEQADIRVRELVEELAIIDVGTISNRDQLPLLLNKLGLRGLGVELGVASGCYSDKVLERSELRVLFSVDRWSDHHNDAECDYAHSVLSKHKTRSSVLRMTFEEAIEIFADDTFDFIYLDGYAHTGQDGLETLKAWWKKLKPGGVFSGHDYHSAWPATVAVVDEFVAALNLELHTTSEDPTQVEHAYPTWYMLKPLGT